MASMARTSLLRAGASSAFAAPSRQPIAIQLLKRSQLAQRAAFQTSSRQSLLPMGPQVVHGTINDPAPVPSPSPTHGHYEWTFYRILAAGLVPLSVAPFAAGTSLNPTLDAIFGAGLLVHAHLSVQTVIVDYVPTKHYPLLRKICWWGLNAATVLAGVGLYEFETTDVGIVEATKRIWKA